MSSVSSVRALAFEVIRATFEDGAFTELAFRAAADRDGLAGRERAQAQRLAYGAVQRRGTADAAIERLAGRSTRLLDPPVLAALRLGLYELLFADATPDHAAVDQAVELVKAAGAAHASGLVNAVLRRAARERAELISALLGDDSTPEAAAVAHSAPLWLARMWWEELGAEPARSLLVACNEPTPVAFRASGDRDALLAELREAGVDAHVPRRRVAARGAGDDRGRGTDRRLRAGAGRGREADAAEPRLRRRGRGPRPAGGRARPRRLRRAGDQDRAGIAARMGDRGELISVELEPGRAAEVAGQARRLDLRSITVIEADATKMEMASGFDRALIDAPCSDLGGLSSRPDARWRKSPKSIERLVEIQHGALLRAAGTVRPGGTLVYATCTISRRENEDRIAALLEAARVGEAPPLSVEDLGVHAPGLASPVDSRCLQLRPDSDRTTGFFICRMRRDQA